MSERQEAILSESQMRYYHFKDGADRVLAGMALILLSPVFLAAAAAIKWEEGLKAPVFFTQKRVGLHKKHFTLYKFRSMRLDTPHDTPTHLLADPDQYLTRAGRWLRRTSLDELPQLWNIFRGEMAVIGPRPALWNQFDLIAERDKYGANDVKPGLTGWAQIHGRDELEIPEKARLDGDYVRRFGPWIDFLTFCGTIGAVVKSDGVVEGGTGAMKKAGQKPGRKEGGRKAGKKAGRRERKKAEPTVPHEIRKILILTNHSYMLYQFRRELIAALAEKHEVVLSMPFVGREDDFRAMGLRCIETPVDRRGINPMTDLKLCRMYREMLQAEKPDLVITYSIKPNIYGGWACRRLGIPYYANVQGLGTAFEKPVLAAIVTLMYRGAFRHVQGVFFENRANAMEFLKRGILKRDQITLLRGAGVNLEHYTYEPYPAEAPVHFLYLGRIMREKGMDELFAAASRLKEEGADFVLDLVGFYEDEYRHTVERLEQAGIVAFHGFQEDPRPYYAAAHCVVLPSYHEGMSNVLLEAAATGRALITTNIPGCREAVEHGKNGILCKVKDADSLYRAMKKFLTLSPEKREAMGAAGRAKMEAEFEKSRVVDATMRALGL